MKSKNPNQITNIFQRAPEAESTCRPLQLLRRMAEMAPRWWQSVDEVRQLRSKGLSDWPDYCFLPTEAARNILEMHFLRPLHCDMLESGGLVLAALSAWRMTKGIYRFDPDVLAALKRTPLPAFPLGNSFERLPEWCVYCETPGFSWLHYELHGFWAHLQYDPGIEEARLHLALDIDGRVGLLELSLADSLAEDIKRAQVRGLSADGSPMCLVDNEALYEEHVRCLAPLVSMALYLCSEGREIDSASGGGEQPGLPTEKRVKRGMRMFAKDSPTHWNVAVRTGATLRAARTSHESSGGHHGGHKRPHVRLAHWHPFKVGPRKEEDGTPIPPSERPTRVKWLHQVVVNEKWSSADLPAVVRKVPNHTPTSHVYRPLF